VRPRSSDFDVGAEIAVAERSRRRRLIALGAEVGGTVPEQVAGSSPVSPPDDFGPVRVVG